MAAAQPQTEFTATSVVRCSDSEDLVDLLGGFHLGKTDADQVLSHRGDHHLRVGHPSILAAGRAALA